MIDIIIIGNSGAARECYDILLDIFSDSPSLAHYYQFKGFLAWKGYPADLKQLSHLQLDESKALDVLNTHYIIGIGNPKLRKEIFEEFKSKNATFMNLIHPWSSISSTVEMGEGNIFQRGCTVHCNAKIGNANYLNGAVNLSHDAEIGNYNFLAPYSMVLGNSKLGSSNHLGPQSILLENAKVGDNNLLAPSSVIYKGCKNNCRMMGSPALKVGEME